MKYRYDIVQNSEEWDIIKYGKFSASTGTALLMDKKNKGYNDLIDKIIEERITNQRSESKAWQGNYTTERGHELEPVAREDFEMRTFNTVTIIGVIELNDWVLCSPDGLIDDDKLHQIKCPIFNTQRKYLKLVEKHKALTDNEILKKIDSTYYKQEQFELFVSGRKEAIWTSYHPSLPPIDLTIVRDEYVIAMIESRLIEAQQEVEAEIETIKSF
jgi:hypothetical protein